jgi:predicted amidohydrolase
MQTEVRVALGQLKIEVLCPEQNLVRIEAACRTAGEQGADLIVLPELANLGQVPSFDRHFAERYIEAADGLNDSFVNTIRDFAREISLHVVIGIAERHETVSHTIFNTAVVIDGTGNLVGVQRKLHLPGEERHYFGVGDRVEVINTDLGVLAAQICYDLYFPEVARAAALSGSEILIGIANIPHRDGWPDRIAHLAAVRAYENMQHVVLVNRIGSDHGTEYGGESVAVIPPGVIVARLAARTEVTETVVLRAEVLLAERARRPVFADRRPELYGAIVAPTAGPAPFLSNSIPPKGRDVSKDRS